jgi:hypothetical protein
MSLTPLALFLAVFPLINFSFCIFVALISVPLFLTIRPRASRLLNVLQVLVLLVMSPIALLGAVGLAMDIDTAWHALVDNHVKYGGYGLLFLCIIYAPLSLSHLSLFV